ncbi:hypothetical protein V502_00686 [Pseudogymnoascus sp. VKM F-4520 (FW-2644)]|nr:hypothetical protein V502_00686 [Pseudogymnoascus sp. VKM F-4520 (FW-2644)]
MLNFRANADALEREGVYIGDWGFRNVLKPSKNKEGQYDTSEDRIERLNTLEPDWEAKEERALVRKLDLRVLFPCVVIYVLAYLDRSNLGNVKILQKGGPDSLESSLNLANGEFNWAVSIAYFTVTAMLIPATLLLKKLSAKIFFPICMVLWGTIVMSMSACTNSAGLYAARFFLGVPESGVVTSGIMFFSFWYKPSERAIRIGIFYSSNSIAQAISGFLAVGINHLNGSGGLKSWQWVFIIEGAMSIFCAIPIYFILLTFPEDSTALSDRGLDEAAPVKQMCLGIRWHLIMARPSTYAFFLSYVCIAIAAVSQATFLPTILKSLMKFDTEKANIYTAIVNIVAVPLYWTYPLHSDWTRERMWHFIVPVAASIPCYAVWTYAGSHPHDTSISYIAMYGMAFLGQLLLVAQPVLLSYRSSTLYGAAEQAVGTSTAVASLSIASIIAPQMYPNSDAPYYLNGFTATVSLLAASIVIYATVPFFLQLEASQRKKKTGHALPLQSLEDSENSQVSAAAMVELHQLNQLRDGDDFLKSKAAHKETV